MSELTRFNSGPNPRRPWRRWVVLGGVGLLALVAAWLLREGNLDRLGLQYLNHKILAGSNLRIRWSRLRGNPIKKVDVEGLAIDLRDDDGWHPFLRANEVELDAGIPQLLKAVRLQVALRAPRIWLLRRADGTYLTPHLRASGGGAGLEVAAIEVEGGSVAVVNGRDTTLWATLVTGAGSLTLGSPLHIAISRLCGKCPPRKLDIAGAQVVADLQDSTWRWRKLQAHGPGFALQGQGRFVSARDYEVETALDSLDLQSLDPWTGSSMPRGRYAGRIHLRGRGAQLQFTVAGGLGLQGLGNGQVDVEGIRLAHETRLTRARVGLPAGSAAVAGNILDAGQATGTWEAQGLNLEKLDLLPPAWRLAGTTLAGHGEIQLGWDRTGLRRLGGRAALSDFILRGRKIRSLETRVAYEDRTWRLQGLLARCDLGDLGGDASLGPSGELAGSGTVQALLRPWAASSDSLAGRVGGDWHLSGTLKQPVASGQLEVSGVRWRGLSVESGLAAYSWRGPELEGLTATLSLRNIGLGDVRVPTASLEAGAGAAVRFRLAAQAGDSLLQAQGSVRFKDQVAVVDNARLRLGEKSWDQRGATRLAWGHGGITWRDFDWTSPDGDSVASSGSYVPSRGTLEARLDAHRWALGPLTAHFLGNRIQEGLLSGDVEVQGSLEQPTIQVNATVERAMIQDHPIQLLEVSGTYAAGQLALAHLRIRRERGELKGSGSMDLPQLRERGAHAFDSGAGPWLDRGSLRADLHIQGLDLSELSEFSDSLSNLSGRLGGDIHIEGPVTSPLVRARLEGDSLVIRDFQGGHMKMALRLESEVLHLDSLETDLGKSQIAAHGYLPVRFSLQPLQLTLPDREMQFTAHVHEVDLQLATLVFLKDFLAYTNGTFSMEVEAAGTIKKPRLTGKATLKGATVRPYGREEIFRNLGADLSLDGSTITLLNLAAEVGHSGRLKGSGKLEVGDGKLSGYHFDLVATDATVTDQENYSLVVSGNLTVDPSSTRDRGPLVRGEVTVSQGLLLMEFGKSSPTLEATHEQPAFRWYYDLGVTVPSDLWWRNSTANIEVGGEMRASNLTGQDIGQGTFDIRRGSYDIYDTSFRITSGTVGFNGLLIDPVLTLEAETSINGQKLLVNIPGGKVSELQNTKNLVFSSDPPGLSQDDIVRLLTVGRILGDAELSAEAVKSNTLTIARGLLATRVQRVIERSAAGIVDVVDIGSTYENNEEVTKVGVGKYVGPDLFVKYAQGLGTSIDRELSVEWRLSKIFVVRGETIRRLSSTSGVSTTDTESNVDLKMRLIF